MNKVCEHEWDRNWRIKEDNICPATGEQCDDECCPPGAVCNLKPNDFIKESTDFKIEENLSQINKQQWEDIWDEYGKYVVKTGIGFLLYSEWLKKNYLAPEKK